MGGTKKENEFKKVIIEFNKLQTVSRLHNNLVEINLSTQDDKLKELLIPVIDILNEANKKMHIKRKGTVKTKISLEIEPYKSLIAYCSNCIK